MNRATLRTAALCLAAGLAGLALQAVGVNAVQQIWPGRMVTLAAAILLGPWYGVAASALTLCTSSPIILVTGVLEALIIGAAEVLSIQYIDPLLSDVVPFLVLIVMLVLRPWGLLGTREELDRV